jgi:hypothetical protein
MFLYDIYLVTCRCLRIGWPVMASVGVRWWTSGAPRSGWRRITLAGSGVWWWQVHHTIKGTLPSTSTQLDEYMTLFIYSNACFCIVSNDLAVCFTVGVTRWPALLPGEGMGSGPQGQGDVRCQLQLGGPPSAYSNPSIHSRLTEYTSAARSVHGPEYDPSTQDFEGDLVMRVGGGKKHGRYWLGDSVLDTATTPTLSQIRASDTGQRPPIRPRPAPAQQRMEALQVIFVLFVVHWFLHTFSLHCNIGVKCCRPSWKKRGGNIRRCRRRLRTIGEGWSRCFSGCKILARGWVNLCHLCYSLLLLLTTLLWVHLSKCHSSGVSYLKSCYLIFLPIC